MNVSKTSVLIAGMGGQGVVSIAMILAESAAKIGCVTCLPEHGPEQRGGFSRCTLILSDEEVISPLPQKYHYMVVMDDASFGKHAKQLEPGGRMIVNADLVAPAGKEAAGRLFIPADTMAAELGSVRAANLVLLGALVGAGALVPVELVKEEMAKRFAGKPEVLATNLAAFGKGLETGKK